MLWQSSKANPIHCETTDCIQSTDYLHTKPDLLVNLDSSVLKVAQDTVLGTQIKEGDLVPEGRLRITQDLVLGPHYEQESVTAP